MNVPRRAAAAPFADGGPSEDGSSDGGLSMVETLVSVVIIAAVLVMALLLTLRANEGAAYQRAHAAAVAAVNSSLAEVTALPARDGTALLKGRSQAAVTAHAAAAPAVVPLSQTELAWDPAPAGAPVLPFTRVLRVGRTDITVDLYLGYCYRVGNACDRSNSPSAPQMVRATAVARWTGTGSCAADTCTVASATLIDPSKDRTFNQVIDQLPMAMPDVFCIPAGAPTRLYPGANDSGNLPADAIGIVTPPGKGTLQRDTGTSIFLYTPASAAVDEDTFTYRLTDNLGQTSGTVQVLVRRGAPAC